MKGKGPRIERETVITFNEGNAIDEANFRGRGKKGGTEWPHD